jgi:hypothetical protein
MSALPPKADMFSVKIDVRYVPTTDMKQGLELAAVADLSSAIAWSTRVGV